MKQNDLEAYKKALKQQYIVEKERMYAGFLEQPSRANLRNLCVERFKANTNQEDLLAFKIFFGFEFREDSLNKLKSETDRFRAIENFLRGKTVTNDLNSLNLIAILLDYHPRPFQKFAKQHAGEVTVQSQTIIKKTVANELPSPTTVTYFKNKKTRNILVLAVATIGLFTAGYTAKDIITPTKECMQWQKDHYQAIDCSSQSNNANTEAPIIAYDESNAELKQIKVNEGTTFFQAGKAVVYYCKKNRKEVEFFNQPGFHPLTNKPLHPITKYMINKYIKKKTPK
jgi:hypothetical protein